MTHPTPELFPSRCYAERMAGEGPLLARAVTEVLALLPARLGSRPLHWYIGDARAQPRQVTTDEAAIDALLARALGRAGTFAPFVLADHPTRWRFVVGASFNPVEGVEYLDLSLPGPREEQPADLAGMMDLVGSVGAAFAAHNAFIEDAALKSLYVAKRTDEVVRAKLPPELRHRLPSPMTIPGAAGTLPDLLVPTDFDRRRVPQAVYWINYWTAAQVDTLGRERVLGAGWERIAAAPDGALTLAAAPAPPDLTRAADLDRLRRIVENLDLRGAQERLR